MTPRTAPRCAVLFTLLLFLAAPALAAPPATMSYQGELRDAQGQPVTGTFDMVLGLYDSAEGATSLWSEVQQVEVTDGVFSVVLGSQTPLDLAFDQPYWLGITVGSDPEMAPRKALTTAPYSMRSIASDEAEEVAWAHVTDKPTILGPYANKIMVAKSGGQFTSIQAAIDSITDSAEDNPYLILVGPGLYREKVGSMPAYVSVKGSGRGVTLVKAAAESYVWFSGDHCRLSDLTLINHQSTKFGHADGLFLGPGKTLHVSRVDIEVSPGEAATSRCVYTGDQSYLVASQLSITNVGLKSTYGMEINGGLHADRLSISSTGEGFVYGIIRHFETHDGFLVENSHIADANYSIQLNYRSGSSPAQIRNSRLQGKINVQSPCVLRMSVCEFDGGVYKADGATLSCYGCFDSDYNDLGADCLAVSP